MELDPDIVARVLAAYRDLGLAEERIGSWALPQRDARVLLESLDPSRHRRILEVGTYVGVSTMLLALHAPKAEVHSVDPDLALDVGTPSPTEGGGDSAGSRSALSIAAAAAAALGVADRVHLHRGGFAVGADFASRRGAAADRGAVVGPALCAAHGPFDLVFVDGLHYADAVSADLELAVAHLAPGGVLALHDVVGLWGSNVRWAVHRFLERHREFVLRHEPYREIYYAGGSLHRAAELPAAMRAAHPDRPCGARLVDDSGFRAALLAAALAREDATRLVELSASSIPTFAAEATRLGLEVAAGLDAEPRGSELVLALGAIDELDDAAATRLLALLAERGSPVLLGLTPPGERGVDTPHSRTLPVAMDLLARAGLRVQRDLALDLEPLLLPYWTRRPRPNSNLLHLFVVERGDASAGRPPFDAATYESQRLDLLYRDLLTLHLMGELRMPSVEVAAADAAAAAAEEARAAAEAAEVERRREEAERAARRDRPWYRLGRGGRR